jgi:hypothetical protein
MDALKRRRRSRTRTRTRRGGEGGEGGNKHNFLMGLDKNKKYFSLKKSDYFHVLSQLKSSQDSLAFE